MGKPSGNRSVEKPGRPGRRRAACRLPAGTLRFLTGSLKKQWKRYRKGLKRCQQEFSEKAVHESRVETRRLLSVLELLGPFLDATHLKRMRALLKQHMDTFDSLRDAQVQLLAVGKLLDKFPEIAAFEEYLSRHEVRFSERTSRNIRRIKGRRLARLISAARADVKKWYRHGPSRQTNDILLSAVDNAFARARLLRAAINPADTETFHRTRVAFKKFRYMLETLAGQLPLATDTLCSAMHAYQTRMGEIQDSEMLLQAFERFLSKKKLKVSVARRVGAELKRRRKRLIRLYLTKADQLAGFWPSAPDFDAPPPLDGNAQHSHKPKPRIASAPRSIGDPMPTNFTQS